MTMGRKEREEAREIEVQTLPKGIQIFPITSLESSYIILKPFVDCG